jgi:hypothetical protein
MSTTRRRLEPSAVELVEEAVHLLRRAPAAALAIYYAGAVPFALGVLFFGAHTAWFRPTSGDIATGALAVIALFVALKTAQAEFCTRLQAVVFGAPPARWSWRRGARLLLAQTQVQPWALLATIAGAVLVLPTAWAFAYGQNATVLGDAGHVHRAAVAQAKLWPRQNHLGLLLLTLLALGIWANLAATFIALPWLANRLLGVDNAFGLSGWWYFNTTFLASVTLLTWLAIDPLVKAFYTLRMFHGRARRTGDDIRVQLRLTPAAVLASLVLTIVATTPRLHAAEPAPLVAVAPQQLDRAIDDVLDGADFRWRLHPVAEKKPADDGPLARLFEPARRWVRDAIHALRRGVDDVVDWIVRNLFRRNTETRTGGGAGIGLAEFLHLLMYVFIAAAALLILWLVWIVWRQARRHRAPVVVARPIAAAPPDLRDDNIQAAQLPADGWLVLAREQIGRGEWRLALRALYLATLARLAGEGLIALAKFKTNLDYERELRRRALTRAEIVTRFSTRRRAFEDAWYGRAAPGEADVRHWLAELEGAAPP